MQRAVRTQPSACQPESAHASGAGYALLRSIIALKIKSPREPCPAGLRRSLPAPPPTPVFVRETEPLKLGLETFCQRHFFAAMCFFGGSTRARNARGFLVDTYRENSVKC